MNNLRIIAKSDNNYLVTDEENISLEDTEKEVFLIDKFGRRITSKIPIYRFFREDYNWEPMNKNYEDEILKKSSEEMISDCEIALKRGYTMDDEENVVGVRCVGMPVRDYSGKVVAAISISASAASFDKSHIQSITKDLSEACKTISSRLGYKADVALALRNTVNTSSNPR